MRREYKGRWLTFPFLALAAVAWTVGNLLSEAACRAAPGRHIRVRYEDLRDQPVAVLGTIGAAFGIEVGDAIGRLQRGEAFSVGHNIGGNRIRHEGAVRLDPSKERTREALPRWAELLVLVLCWSLMRRYGYPLGRMWSSLGSRADAETTTGA